MVFSYANHGQNPQIKLLYSGNRIANVQKVSTEGAAISDSVSEWLEQSRKILCKSVLSLVHIFIYSLGIREENGLLNLQQRSSRKRTQVISEVKMKLKLLGIWYEKVEFYCAEWNRWEKSTSHRKQKLLEWYRHAKRNLKVVDAPISPGKARARALFRAWHCCYRRSQTREKIIYSRKKTGKHWRQLEERTKKPLKIEGIVGSCDE